MSNTKTKIKRKKTKKQHQQEGEKESDVETKTHRAAMWMQQTMQIKQEYIELWNKQRVHS